MAVNTLEVFKNCWSDGAKRSYLERKEVMFREWMLGIDILVMVQLLLDCILSPHLFNLHAEYII